MNTKISKIIVHILPDRCECGVQLARHQYNIERLIEAGKTLPEIYVEFGFKRACCKAHIQAPMAAIPHAISSFTVNRPQGPPIKDVRVLFQAQ
jgi:DNA-directed RNA polymerase subunit N (RpoN/RPB10)